MTKNETDTDKTKALQKRVVMVTGRLMTPRQWTRIRTALDMSKEDILNDTDSLAVVMAWFEDGADMAKFEDYLDMPIGELEARLTGLDDAAFEAQLDEVLDAALADDDDADSDK